MSLDLNRLNMINLDFSIYKPGRFQYLMSQPFALEMWQFLTLKENILSMIESTETKKTAIEGFLAQIEDKFEKPLSSPEFPGDDVAVLVNNMILQIMETFGYEHIGCGLCRGKYIKSSGLYQKSP